jgi:hypothetical protein
MAVPYEQATEAYLVKALEFSETIAVDSPNRARSVLKRGVWHLRNFDGDLIARVGKGEIRFAVL